MALVDEWAGVRWRRGLACRLPRLWLDAPRAGAIGLLADADVPVPPRARVFATPMAAGLAKLPAGRALQVPYGQPFQLGAGAVELLPSGASLGGAIARLHAKGQTLLAVQSASLEARPSAAPLDLRDADVLILDAELADAQVTSLDGLQMALRIALAAPAAVWLLQQPLLSLDLLLWSDGAVRLAPALLRLASASGLPILTPQSAGRQPRGLLLWPLQHAARLPQSWRDVPQTVLAEPGLTPPTGVLHLPVSRRLAGTALDVVAQQSRCETVLAWGAGAESLSRRLTASGQLCHVLRMPYQLPLV